MHKNLQQYTFTFLALIGVSCGNQNTTALDTSKVENPIATEFINDSNFKVKEAKMYGTSFLDSLKHSGYSTTYEIIDRTLIVDQTDTTMIPVYLTMGKAVEFSGSKNGRSYFIVLTQLNYTSIGYTLSIYEDNKLIDQQTGTVELGPLFFLAAESDEDYESGDSYLSTEYSSSNNDCVISIRLGENESRELLVKSFAVVTTQQGTLIWKSLLCFAE